LSYTSQKLPKPTFRGLGQAAAMRIIPVPSLPLELPIINIGFWGKSRLHLADI